MSLDTSGVGGTGGIQHTPPPGSLPADNSGVGKLGRHTVQTEDSVTNKIPKQKSGSDRRPAPPPPPLGNRTAVAESGRSVVGQSQDKAATEKTESSAAEETDSTKKPQKRTLREKIKHMFGELKRFLTHQQWQQIPQSKIDELPKEYFGELRGKLEGRNKMVLELDTLKGRAKELGAQVSEYEKKHQDAIKLLKEDRPPADSKTYVDANGKEYNFKELIGRREKFAEFQASFNTSSEYKQYQESYRELAYIPEQRAQIKNILKAENSALKADIDIAEDKLAEIKHDTLDKEVREKHQSSNDSITKVRKNHREQLADLKGQVESLQDKLVEQKERKSFIQSYERPRLKEQLKRLDSQADKRLKDVRKKVSDPAQREALLEKVSKQLEASKEKVTGMVRQLNTELQQYDATRKEIKVKLEEARSELETAKKGKEVKKSIKGIRKEDSEFAKESVKEHKQINKRAGQFTQKLHRTARGRNNSAS